MRAACVRSLWVLSIVVGCRSGTGLDPQAFVDGGTDGQLSFSDQTVARADSRSNRSLDSASDDAVDARANDVSVNDSGADLPADLAEGDLPEGDLPEIVLSPSDLSWCEGSCGGQWPVTVGGFDDTNDVGSWARATDCAGAIQHNLPQENKKTRLCAKPSVASLIRICEESCGGPTPHDVGGWQDTSDISDVAYDVGCTGTIAGRIGKKTLICVADSLVSKINVCNESCGTATSVGGWSDGSDIWDLALEPGCSGTLAKRQDKNTFLCVM